LLGAVLTAFYMFRLYLLAFRGESRLTPQAEHHLHESPPTMIIPLAVLAALSVVGGLVGLPFQEGGNLFARWLAPVFEGGHAAEHALPAGTEMALIAISIVVAVTGVALAFRVYGKRAEGAARGARAADPRHAAPQVLDRRAPRRTVVRTI
jgi:NADH-quinone oxidoreductase subunit L